VTSVIAAAAALAITDGRGALSASTVATGKGVVTTASSTLVLYDTTGAYGWLGEAYATLAANLASHFGAWTAHPVGAYVAGEVNHYSAVIYIGSTYDEPIPTAFLDDVVTTAKPVVWLYDNIWQVAARHADFQSRFDWMPWEFDYAAVSTITYKNIALSRVTANGDGIMSYSYVGPNATVLATATRPDGSTFPWAIRSRNVTYIGEIPLSYIAEGDRYLAFVDILYDALNPGAALRHRALVRIEDVNATDDPTMLRAIADYLSGKGVPFAVGVIPAYVDPNGYYNDGVPQTVYLHDNPDIVSALKYMQAKGGFLINHGWTHQYSNVNNPYTAVSADDYEFYRVTENSDHTLNYQGPIAGDSSTWATSRFDAAKTELTNVGLPAPIVWEFPHYAASATDYKATVSRFSARYERSLYFGGALTGATPNYSHVTGQFFPFVVRDIYGGIVLPEDLGSIEPQAWFIYPARLPANIVADGKRTLAVRDGFASFFFHPFLSLSYLQDTVTGLQSAGYTFVKPRNLITATTPDVVIDASDVTSTKVHGAWTFGWDATSPAGVYLGTPDAGATVSAALPTPSDYFDVTFKASSGKPYHVWLRMRAPGNSTHSDSVWVQFSDATVNGSSAYAIGSSSALAVTLQACSTCADAGWGWRDKSWDLSQSPTVTFASGSSHTIRIQVREDGAQVDQIVLSPSTYLSAAPGASQNDRTVVTKLP